MSATSADNSPRETAAAAGRDGLLETLVAAAGAKPAAGPPDRLASFLAAEEPPAALAAWLRISPPPKGPRGKREIVEQLGRDIALLDQLLNDQLNAVLHHPRFQRLEAAWRGLHYLVRQAAEAEQVKIRVLDVSWRELARDLERAIEFDQSQLFRKVYSEEFGSPGGEPFGLLVGDYEIRPRPQPDHPIDDVDVLRAVSQVAAAAFAPFLAAAHPSLLDLEDFAELERPLDLARTFEQTDYLKWRSFRQTEDARFVGLCLPRILLRTPYRPEGPQSPSFPFREETAGPDSRRCLWGNAAFAFAGVAVRAFGQSGWLAGVRGVPPDLDGGGVVRDLPAHWFATDRQGAAAKMGVEVAITESLEKELSELGFLPLCHCPGTPYAAFHTSHSVQQPKTYDRAEATMNARLSALLQYMLCVSRLAHYLKASARDRIGAFREPGECERRLHDWLQRYVTSDADAGLQVKARYPLRHADVRVREHPGKPGAYVCVAHLWPHFELDGLTAAVRVTTELLPGRAD